MLKTIKPLEGISVATNTNSLFKSPINDDKDQHCIQNVNVTVNVDQKDDVLTTCFNAMGRIFKRK